ncbi:MAG: ATP synthase F1 subunit epsilon [Rhodospirillales bacterium]|tara:strand:+ start:144 stop:563 length:420 start_codon:yes stop_codon:yes gene_type:complete
MSDVKMNKVSFELVTPTSLAVSEDVDMVVVPGVDGDFGVLRGHTPILTTVRPGCIKMYQGGKVVKTFFIEGGIAEANSTKCTVLAEYIHNLEDITQQDAEWRLSKAKENYEGNSNTGAKKELEIARALLGSLNFEASKH